MFQLIRKLSILSFCFLLTSKIIEVRAQELQAKVRISTESLGTVEQSQYKALESQLSDLLNKTHWTKLKYSKQERIPCSFSLKLTELKDNNKYQAELSVSAARTAFNTAYDSPIFVYIDKNLNFEWDLGTPLSYQEQSIDNHLIACLAFYAYTIIGMSWDSFALEASSELIEQIKLIQNQAQSQPQWQGWDSFSSDSRSSIFTAITDPKHKIFRELWYRYHRLGLDICEKNIAQGRQVILDQVRLLKNYQEDFYESFYIRLFEVSKLNELILLFQEGSQKERDELRKILNDLYPTHQEELDKLRISQ